MSNLPATRDSTTVARPEYSAPVRSVLSDPRFDGTKLNGLPAIGQPLRVQLERAETQLNEYLLPPSRDWLMGRCATLLAHYWVPEMGPSLQEAVARDWGIKLERFPAWAIEKACQDYMSAEPDRRPTPGRIEKLCIAEISSADRHRAKIRRALDRPEPGDEKKTESSITKEEALKISAAMMAKLKAGKGFF